VILELFLDPNGDQIKLTWRSDSAGSRAKPLLLSKPLLEKRGQAIRNDLTTLSNYVGVTDLQPGRDPGWVEYKRIVAGLRTHGQALYRALFDFNDSRARKLASELAMPWPRHSELKIHCSDEQVTLPLGFVFCAERASSLGNISHPSRTDFSGFWLNRFRISMLVAGSGCNALDIDPTSFRTLYAMHRRDLEKVYDRLGADGRKLDLLINSIEFRQPFFDWPGAELACTRIADWHHVVFVFAHSDGDYLALDGSSIDSLTFAEMLQRVQCETQTTLVILNCCFAVSGDEHSSLLRSVAAPGFCGLIGTEAEILNTHAIRCGTRLMWSLCARGQSLGKAFDRMQRDVDLFPLNLLYTCYADRRFKLTQPFVNLGYAV
jgi:hypothetical protein